VRVNSAIGAYLSHSTQVAFSIVVAMSVFIIEIVLGVQHLGGIEKVPDFMRMLVIMSIVGLAIA
jgi:hypothetical protein